MRIYIIGPMTGHAEKNYPAFAAAAAQLRRLGHEVISPHELNPELNTGWVDAMRVDIPALCSCEAVALLPGWKQSVGAVAEVGLADLLELHRFYLYRLNDFPAAAPAPGLASGLRAGLQAVPK